MELRLLWISTILLGKAVGSFAWTTRSGLPTTTRCRSSSRLILLEHASSQTTYHPPHPPHYPDLQDDHTAIPVTNDASAKVETTPVSTAPAVPVPIPVPRNRASWMDRVEQLQEYAAIHRHTLVPKRYKANPALGNWVNKQRQSYRKYLRNEQPCSLTSQHVEILNSIGFCWDASNVTTATAATIWSNDGESSTGDDDDDDDAWWSRLKEFERYMASSDNYGNGEKSNVTSLLHLPRHAHESSSQSPPIQNMRAWILDQRRDHQRITNTNAGTTSSSSRLSVQQIEALSAIDPDWWKNKRQVQWDVRYRQLQDYKQEHGDCCVPISYANKQLANWVHNQRKQYNLRLTGKASDLTTERFNRLQDIGFVWNRWEYEFTKKQVQRDVILDWRPQ